MAGMRSLPQTHTSQFLLPDALALLLGHVLRRWPEVGHDHQELLEADLLDRPVVVLVEVSVRAENILTYLNSRGVKSQSGGTASAAPSVEKGLDDLGADGVAGQIRDGFEMFPPESRKGLFKLPDNDCKLHLAQQLVRQVFKSDRATY